MKRKSARSINFRTPCSATRPAGSGTSTPSGTNTISIDIGIVSRPSSITTKAAGGCEGRSMCLQMYSRKKSSSMNLESTQSTNSGSSVNDVTQAISCVHSYFHHCCSFYMDVLCCLTTSIESYDERLYQSLPIDDSHNPSTTINPRISVRKKAQLTFSIFIWWKDKEKSSKNQGKVKKLYCNSLP